MGAPVAGRRNRSRLTSWMVPVVACLVVVTGSGCRSAEPYDATVVRVEKSGDELSLVVRGAQLPIDDDRPPPDEIILKSQLTSVSCQAGGRPEDSSDVRRGGTARFEWVQGSLVLDMKPPIISPADGVVVDCEPGPVE